MEQRRQKMARIKLCDFCDNPADWIKLRVLDPYDEDQFFCNICREKELKHEWTKITEENINNIDLLNRQTKITK